MLAESYLNESDQKSARKFGILIENWETMAEETNEGIVWRLIEIDGAGKDNNRSGSSARTPKPMKINEGKRKTMQNKNINLV